MRPAHVVLFVVAGLALAGAPALAQHETAADIAAGERVFRDNCANCHGPDGDQVAGVDLGRGLFRRASTDEDLVRIIRNGIPDTPMPASNFSEEQAARVVAYLRSVAAAGRGDLPAGDAARGRALFLGKGTCATCHRVDGAGSRLGPDLSGIGRRRRVVELEQSLVEPDAEVEASNRFYQAVTRDGATVTGRLLNLDTFTVQLLDSTERLRSLDKTSLSVHGFVETSPMPSYRDRLSPQELADVVSYLVSLKGR
jgi:putative heme-binding domain-containing protein